MAVTVTDVARAAGVAVSTVSYAMSGTRKISDETRRRVLQAMEDLGYTPNVLARGLRGGHSRVIALLFPLQNDIVDATGLDYLLGASDHAQALGYHLVLWTTEGPGLDQLRQLAGRGLVDGVLLMQVTLDDARPKVLADAKIPFSMIGRAETPVIGDCVDLDGVAAARTAVEYLAGLGHRAIGLVEQPDAQLNRRLGLAMRIREGVAASAAERGVEVIAASCSHDFDGGYAVFNHIMDRHPEVTALIAHNEPALGGILTAAADRGIVMPRDLSVVAVGMGKNAAEGMCPPLTTVSIPGRLLGRMAVDHLIGRLAGDSVPPRSDVFPGELTVRRSSGPAPR